ncbi:hypothetical protein Q6D67_20790 [Haliea sp. E1-2-M8]|uniref:hypothetical protein n=1 Tax=Haliea sp. E1-2-M8 TaxID=3064706 RepID=UPI00271D4C90|nr:hypothetical protein [Haliea sp. E1-2-M8]MDO8864128.1 hypothetical protein [Haliea sp. E1-2-M8]
MRSNPICSLARVIIPIFYIAFLVGCTSSTAVVEKEKVYVGMNKAELKRALGATTLGEDPFISGCFRQYLLEKKIEILSSSSESVYFIFENVNEPSKGCSRSKLGDGSLKAWRHSYAEVAEYFEQIFPETEVYNIDTLRVTTEKMKTDICASGAIHKIILEGTISPDSSFAMGKLLQRSPHCRNSRGQVIVATTVQLKSGGGYLVDGYKLGRSLRESGATTLIENQTGCASSCAVAFLGGKKRVVEDAGSVMFHAPYFSGKNSYGEKVIDCDIPEPDLQILNDYYSEMVGKEAGDRLYDRTMWYCSAEDGWVVSGGSAAELFDIATEK